MPDMPSIHETIESDESFSSLSDAEEEQQNDEEDEGSPAEEKQQDHFQKQQQQQPAEPVVSRGVTKKSSRRAGQGGQGSSRGVATKSLVEYSDVSSEDFSEPEAGEITDSPGRSIVAPDLSDGEVEESPPSRTQQRVAPPPVQNYDPLSALAYNYNTQPSYEPQRTASYPAPSGSGSSGVAMSPDRHALDSRDYPRSRDHMRSRSASESSQRDRKLRKKEHRKEKKRKHEKKHKRDISPDVVAALHKKRKKKNKRKSRDSGSPGMDDDNDDSPFSSDCQVTEPGNSKEVHKYPPSQDSRTSAKARNRLTVEVASPLSSDGDAPLNVKPPAIGSSQSPIHDLYNRTPPTRPRSPRSPVRHPRSPIPPRTPPMIESPPLHREHVHREPRSPPPSPMSPRTPPLPHPSSRHTPSPPPMMHMSSKRKDSHDRNSAYDRSSIGNDNKMYEKMSRSKSDYDKSYDRISSGHDKSAYDRVSDRSGAYDRNYYEKSGSGGMDRSRRLDNSPPSNHRHMNDSSMPSTSYNKHNSPRRRRSKSPGVQYLDTHRAGPSSPPYPRRRRSKKDERRKKKKRKSPSRGSPSW